MNAGASAEVRSLRIDNFATGLLPAQGSVGVYVVGPPIPPGLHRVPRLVSIWAAGPE